MVGQKGSENCSNTEFFSAICDLQMSQTVCSKIKTAIKECYIQRKNTVMQLRGRKCGCVVWGGTMTTACKEDLGDGRKSWVKSEREWEKGGSWQSLKSCVFSPIRHCCEGSLPVSLSITSLYKTWLICGPSGVLAARTTKQFVQTTLAIRP